jgi:TonB family protein
LYNGWPSYTEVARRNKTMGRVRANVEFRSDGAIGNVTIVAGLPDGLSEMAIKAIRQMVFLPAVGTTGFETTSRPIDVDFNLR